jgi:hypothetical protein
MGDDHFCCDVCHSMQPLQEDCMAVLECPCLICKACSQEHIQASMKPQQEQLPQATHPAQALFSVGQEVRYRDRHKNLVMAVVVQIDRSIQPPQ